MLWEYVLLLNTHDHIIFFESVHLPMHMSPLIIRSLHKECVFQDLTPVHHNQSYK